MQTEQDKTKSFLKGLSDAHREDIKRNLENIEPYPGHENYRISELSRAVMAEQVSEKMKEIFDIMKLDYRNDPNLKDTQISK